MILLAVVDRLVATESTARIRRSPRNSRASRRSKPAKRLTAGRRVRSILTARFLTYRLTATALGVALTIATFLLLTGRPAEAGNRQLSVIEDSARVLSPDPATQDAALDEMRNLDADIVKIPVIWRNAAPRPTSRAKPSADLSDPGAYPAGAWTVIDRAVLGASIRGLGVWLMLTAPAPRWAVSREDAEAPGTTRPDPKDFAEFAEAAGRHFGSVKIWSIWNEPNLSLFLRPQFQNGVAVSAVHYRKLYRAGYEALRGAGHGRDTILFGELLPRAPLPRRANGTVPPLIWLREFFCLDTQLKAYIGAEARKHGCTGFKPIKTSGFAYHPYTTPDGPFWKDPRPDSAMIQHLGRVFKVLDAASRSRHLAQRRLKVYSSEFGFQSNPPDRTMIPIDLIPLYLNASEYLSYRNSRVATYSQYLLRDDDANEAFQSGLRFKDGSPKPGVYDAYRMPIVVVRRSASSVLVWGKVRDGSSGSPKIEIQVDDGSGFRKYKTVRVNRRSGYFQRALSGVNADGDNFRTKSGNLFSRETKAELAPTMMP